MQKGERRPNIVYVLGDVSIVMIEQRDGTKHECLIDTADLNLIRTRTWSYAEFHAPHSKRNGYAICKADGVFMHRLILSAPDGVKVDHIHHNGMDNRRSQIRLATDSINNHNRMILPKNVYFHPQSGKWRVRFMLDRKCRSFGLFKNKSDAESLANVMRERILKGLALPNRSVGKFGYRSGEFT